MAAEKSVSKGGSWDSSQYAIEIKADGGYSRPSPTLGFRVFMKVVEQ
jgi:hypothetical protein